MEELHSFWICVVLYSLTSSLRQHSLCIRYEFLEFEVGDGTKKQLEQRKNKDYGIFFIVIKRRSIFEYGVAIS